jgi:membrane fusion protein, copper/silver efflux system
MTSVTNSASDVATPSVAAAEAQADAQAAARRARGRRWRRLASAIKIAEVRLRLFVVLLGGFLIVGQWETLRAYWERLTAPAGSAASPSVISSDTEYFCPMCPGVVSDWPSKCSVCNMGLVRRKKGEAIHLPDGVLARMQLSPYRVQLAGIETSEIGYRPLTREVVAPGRVAQRDDDGAEESVQADILVRERDLVFIHVGQAAEVTCEAFALRTWPAHVSEIADQVTSSRSVSVRVTIDADDGASGEVADEPERQVGALLPGMSVVARLHSPIDRLGPFRSQPSGPPPLDPDAPRKVYLCPDHPDAPHLAAGVCPEDDNKLLAHRLNENQRLEWWCPMHPKVTADHPGEECGPCNGMKLLPRVVTYRPVGEVLAVPESAVIDTGARKVVYVERMAGMFDAVEVVLGGRCGEFYPIVSGLEAGQRVASAGALLIDAESRLNPSVAAGYFGAARSSADVEPHHD